MAAEPLASLKLPFDLASLLSFTLADPFAQTLANSSCNDFFESYTAEDGSGRIRVSLKEQRGGWGALPLEWREYFQTFKEPAARSDILERLTSLEIVSTSSSGRFRARTLQLTSSDSDNLLFIETIRR